VNIVVHPRHLISRPSISERASFLATLVALSDRRDVYASERGHEGRGAAHDTGLHSFLALGSSLVTAIAVNFSTELRARFLRILMAV
jgi:hypothetical protein